MGVIFILFSLVCKINTFFQIMGKVEEMKKKSEGKEEEKPAE